MIEFIEKNKRLLVVYSTALRTLGWILLAMGGIGVVLLIIDATQMGGTVDLGGTFGMLKRSNSINISIAMVSLGFAQLIRYLCGNVHRMGLLLRYSEKIFYLCAIIAILNVGGLIWVKTTDLVGGNRSLYSYWLLYFLPILLYKSAKILILVGLGQFFKHFIAAIEQSKPNLF